MRTIFSILLLLFSLNVMSQSLFQKEWQAIDSLNNLGQPESALKLVNDIYEKAKISNQADQFLKASICRMMLEADFKEDYFEKAIERTQLEIQSAKAPVRQILHSMTAELYWRYYQRNRWKILDRSQTVNFDNTDLKTWDLKKIVSACMEHYEASLSDKELLQKTALTVFDEILIKQKDSQKFRPTLYDLLVHRAIDFYSSSDAGLTKPADTFQINKAGYLSPADQFASLNIASPDSFSFEYQTLKLYQEAILFHLKDSDPDPLIDVDLERLSYIGQKSIHPEKDSLYLAALRHLEEQYKNHPASTEVAFRIAGQLNGDDEQVILFEDAPNSLPEISAAKKWNKKKAVEICQAAIDRFPDSFGANNCSFLIERIKEPSLSITTAYASIIGKPSIALVQYQNVPKVYLRLLKIDIETYRELQENEQDTLLEIYLSMKPQHKWQQTLPDDGDYRRHATEIKIPALPGGHYVLLASSDPSFTVKSSLATVCNFWVSNISYLSKENNQFMVLHRITGQPLEGIKAELHYREYNSGTRKFEIKEDAIYFSDAAGIVNIPPVSLTTSPYNFCIAFKLKDDQLVTDNNYYSSPLSGNETPTYVQTHYFTDRAIYRPGQIIYFKGIVLERKGEDVKIKAGYTTEVTFFDNNNQVISKKNLTTNEFGSFSGSFTAPQGALTGEMSIRGGMGMVSIRVEEYKRPKFEVSFDPIKGSYRLGEMITAKGKSISYAGSTVSGAKVHYRVVRQTRFPFYWGEWRHMPRPEEMEITNGDTVTSDDGSFSIPFKAIPDPTVARTTNPVYSYTVYADVTDINGESHSSETNVSIGYNALMLTTDLEEKVNLEKEFKFSLSTTNLNGEKEPASGTIQLYQLKQPKKVLYSRKWDRPDRFTMSKRAFEREFPGEVYNNDDDVTTWPKESVSLANFITPADSIFTPENSINPGRYLIEIKTKDAFGDEIVYQKYFTAFHPKSNKTEVVSPLFFSLLTPTVEPGQDAVFVVGTANKNASLMYEITKNDKVLNRVFLKMNKEQHLIRIPVTEEYRGNISINLCMVSNNRAFMETKQVEVPFTNKKLDIHFTTFRNKMLPGQEEEWQLTLTGPKGEKVAAEMLAAMYDASLDAFLPHNWTFNIFNANYGTRSWNQNHSFGVRMGNQLNYLEIYFPIITREYDQLNWFGFGGGYYGGRGRMYKSGSVIGDMSGEVAYQEEISTLSSVSVMNEVSMSVADVEGIDEENGMDIAELNVTVGVTNKPTASSAIQIRKNFNETAFFYPNLTTNEKGEIVIKFKVPDALTRWKIMGLAHTKDLKYGEVGKTLITQKDLMIFTNAPRFMREGDQMDFAAKISNISNKDLTGTAELHFFDALTMHPIDSILGLANASIPFTATKGGSSPVSWKISIPVGLQAITYRITATAGNFSDGEEAAIPVLTNRMLVTESLPLPVKGNQTKEFIFAKLVNSNSISSTLRNYRLSLEYTSNPAWYAVQALPTLMEFPHECAEQLFSRYYANSLATHIANSDPKIKRVFDNWKKLSPDALKSNLEKNQELKSVLLQESPWVREATHDSERKQRIALLFDLNRMASEQTSALKKLAEMQNFNGGWPWFPGMPESQMITQHIVAGIGHLVALKALPPTGNSEIRGMLMKAIGYMDETLKMEFEKIKKNDKDYLKNNHLDYSDIQYLYARTYFMDQFPLDKQFSEMVDYYKAQTVKNWKSNNNYLKGMMALYMNRLDDQKTALLIMRSLKETALHNEDMGMYWRNEQRGWYWHQAPIETQALLIEAFDEVSHDLQSVEEMKIWLLKQKQTQDWKTTKATTEAVYALLLRGASLLASDKQVEITLGNEKVDPYQQDGTKPEAGTGYFKTSWEASAITPEMGKVRVNNPNPTVAWGAMYWQYFEQLDKITPAQTPLSLNKKLFREVNTTTGPVIEPITENSTIQVGDKIVVRVELRTDRTMEYIHLKDMRASAFEPVNVLSGYRWQDGLGYYESTLDASTNFFISYLPKGTYVFEYKLTATQKGEFSNGITSVQCMYAPEFTSHSEGIRIKVK